MQPDALDLSQNTQAELERKLANRTVELKEALEQQGATAEILKIISRSKLDVAKVMNTLARKAVQLCAAENAAVFLHESDGEPFRLAASVGYSEEFAELARNTPIRPGRGTIASRTLLEAAVVHVKDVLDDPEYTWSDGQRLGGYRTSLGVPMLRDGAPIGVIALTRNVVQPFAERQISLVATFADQAVIAIENARLLGALEARNRELTAALEQQTATSDILRVMSSSPTDVQPVFDSIAQSAVRLCESQLCHVYRYDGERIHFVAYHYDGLAPERVDAVRSAFPMAPDRGTAAGRSILSGAVEQISDVQQDPEYKLRAAASVVGHRNAVGVPMLRDGVPIGTIAVARDRAGLFPDRQIELLQTFADQAVIAIENVRLFRELESRTAALTRSVGELQALGEVSQAVSSTLDLETVLATIVSRAVELSASFSGIIYDFDEATQTFNARASHRISPEHLAALQAVPVRLGEGAIGRAGVTGRPVQVADIAAESHAVARQVQALLAREGLRSLLALPLIREERVLGGFVVLRREPGEFAKDVVGILRTFAAHSVLAIHNAGLFKELEDKGRQLEIASQHKSQFLANMSHELRTPLNAILGYTELMADGIYGEPPEKMRAIIERVQANGKHLLGLINDVLDLSKIEAGQLTLSLSDYSLKEMVQSVFVAVEPLAAEKRLALHVEIDDGLGVGSGDERRLSQVLLNLVGNAIKFTDAGEVTIKASEVGGSFAVSVRDTGPGIAAADQQRIFDEFQQADSSSTRKKGGTGLGLSISKRIIELHGGRLWVDSEPGQGSTFTFSVPVRVERMAKP